MRRLTSKTVFSGLMVAWVFGGVANQSFAILRRPRDVGRGNAVTLVVGDDLDVSVLEHTDARIRGAEVNADRGADGFILVVIVVVGAHKGAGDGQGQGGEEQHSGKLHRGLR